MQRRIGERIGAVQSADNNTVHLFGYGTYQGDHVPPDDVMGPFGRLALFGVRNPKLVMDDGTVVWGCESWWGGEELVRESIRGRQVIIVTPERTAPTDEERKEAAEIIAEVNRRVEEIEAELKAANEAAPCE